MKEHFKENYDTATIKDIYGNDTFFANAVSKEED